MKRNPTTLIVASVALICSVFQLEAADNLRNLLVRRLMSRQLRSAQKLRCVKIIVFGILVCGGQSLKVDAVPLQWTLNERFADGGTAIGVFTFDSDTGTFSNWNVSATGGNTSVFFPFDFTPANSSLDFQPNDPMGSFNFSSNALFAIPISPFSERLALEVTPSSSLSNAGGIVTIVPGLITPRAVECFDCDPYRLITYGTVSTPTPPKVPPDDLVCPEGTQLTYSEVFNPTAAYCEPTFGVPVPLNYLYCPRGIFGPGYIYNPSAGTCENGVVAPFGSDFCPPGIYGSGGFYNPSKGESCDLGVPVPFGDSFCPPGANGSGGFYNPSKGDSCNNGLTLPFGALPPVVSKSQVATTASGLSYSRVSQTFNGTVTIANIDKGAISGPIQILFTGLPANVTLVNPTGGLFGSPYLTVPGIASLAPGQSVTITAQFKNSTNATVKFTPVIYSGSIN